MLSEKQLKQLQKASYKIIGKSKHSAVKLCLWCKKSIKSGGENVCYKQKFYGINSHRCLQMTPCLTLCNLRCNYCWRDHSYFNQRLENIDPPEEIIEESIKAQRKLLTGLGGVEHSEKFLKEAMNPNQVAISLDGEPTMYPFISELIDGYKKRGFTTFLVTNGTFPEVLKKITLPYQLYVSLSSNSEEMYKKLQNPLLKNCWRKLNETLELFPSLKTRKVIRLTLIKDINMNHPEKYAELIKKASPDFIEAKAWMCIGGSSLRLKYENMPSHDEVKEFSKKISDLLDYKISDESKPSRVVLLKNNH